MAASNTRFTQNSLGQSKNPIDSDHGIYRYNGASSSRWTRRRGGFVAAAASGAAGNNAADRLSGPLVA